MADAAAHHLRRRRSSAGLPRGWCYSFAAAPQSPEHRALSAATSGGGEGGGPRKLLPKSPSVPSFQSSPLSRLAGFIDPRRILSPGHMSPIDIDDSPVVAVGAANLEEDRAPREQAPSVAFMAFLLHLRQGLLSLIDQRIWSQ
ncbi:hypothetical protein E2562_027837 [Oryza meyeriana var. granulata]|uniref:Uncharacterized protein n=1 Tax=Oryza meyeriana var. granulata TaxID=110450 RepID=A0A6G1DNS2_9ORYZ|nr:hypothetical protein E2562_027837 [Oryza meyeriana var. granulata]